MEKTYYEIKTELNLYEFIEANKEDLQDAYIAFRCDDSDEKIIPASFVRYDVTSIEQDDETSIEQELLIFSDYRYNPIINTSKPSGIIKGKEKLLVADLLNNRLKKVWYKKKKKNKEEMARTFLTVKSLESRVIKYTPFVSIDTDENGLKRLLITNKAENAVLYANYEMDVATYIKTKISEEGGSLDSAARILGLNSRQSLYNKLDKGTFRSADERKLAEAYGYEVVWVKKEQNHS